jgi:CRP-like cAMP-binding protein
MGHGLIEEATKWRRRGLAEPWLADSFLADLSPSALSRLERDASLLRADQIDRGAEQASQQLASHTGAPVAIVLDGAVKVFHTRWDGPDVLVNIAGPGDVLNVEEFLTGVATITRYASSGNAVLLAIPREKFREFLGSDEEAQRVLTLGLARRVQTLTIQRGHAGRKVEQRLWAFLVHLARRHGRRIHDGRTLLRGLTQADLAAAVGASINSVEAAMRTLRIAGKLTSGYAQVILHELPTEDELDKSFWRWTGQLADDG